MVTWIDTLQMMLGEITDYFEPNSDVNDHDNVVGVADDDLKALYTLWMQLAKQAIELLVQARFANNESQVRQLTDKAAENNAKSEIVKEIFWASLKDSFGLWSKPLTGIRKGWKVVWSEPEPPNIDQIIRGLFGG